MMQLDLVDTDAVTCLKNEIFKVKGFQQKPTLRFKILHQVTPIINHCYGSLMITNDLEMSEYGHYHLQKKKMQP